jgi:hypothetical protein
LFSKKKKELGNHYYEKAEVNRAPGEEGVVARIGEEAITEETLAPKLAKVHEKRKEKARKRWVDYLIEKKVFSDEARKVHLENDPEVSRELRRKTDEVLANLFRQRFITDKLRVSDEDIADYYQSHLEAFERPLGGEKDAEIKPLDEVRRSIRMTLIKQHFEEEKQRYYEKARVEVLGA